MNLVPIKIAVAFLISICMAAAVSAANLAEIIDPEETIEDYLFGAVKHLKVVQADVNFHDVLVTTAGDTDGQRSEPLSAKEGKVLLVTFWSQDCLLCRRYLKNLAEVQAAMDPEKFEVVAISLEGGTHARIRKILNQRGLNTLAAYQDFNRNIPARLENDPAIDFNGHEPKTLVIGPEGKVRAFANERKDWNAPEAKALLTALADGRV